MNNNDGMKLTDELDDPKVVQIILNDRPFLCLGNSNEFHYSILEAFLKSMDVTYKTVSIMGETVPALRGENYKVVGMGRLFVNIRNGQKMATFGTNSYMYGIGINKKFVEAVKEHNPEWIVKIW